MTDTPCYFYFSEHFVLTQEFLTDEFFTLNGLSKKTLNLSHQRDIGHIFFENKGLSDYSTKVLSFTLNGPRHFYHFYMVL